eukprot:93209_1
MDIMMLTQALIWLGTRNPAELKGIENSKQNTKVHSINRIVYYISLECCCHVGLMFAKNQFTRPEIKLKLMVYSKMTIQLKDDIVVCVMYYDVGVNILRRTSIVSDTPISAS